MASNPPFQVEDQTDEDFFDNLVNDDNDDHLGSTATAKLVEGNDSDDARAFENLTVEEESGAETEEVLVASAVDKSFEGGLAENAVVAENAVTDCGFGGSGGSCSDNSEPLQPSGIITDNNDDGDKLGTGSTSGSPAGAKEIGWSSFYADSAENGGHGFGSYSDFFNDFGVDSHGKVENNAETSGVDHHAAYYGQNNEASHVYGSSAGDGESRQDTSSSQYWEELYPGWKFDANTGQWYQLNGYNGSNQTSSDVSAGDWGSGMDGKTEVSYLQHTAQSVGGISASAESGTTQSTVGWNQAPQVNNGYPEHMVFDPQYPGWYYDTIAGVWQMLESYNQPSVHSVAQSYEQSNQNGFAGDYTHANGHAFSEHGQTDNYITQGIESHIQNDSWVQDYNNYNGILNNHVNRHSSDSFHKLQSDGKTSHCEANGYSGLTTFVPSENLNKELNKLSSTGNGQLHFSNDFYSGQQSTSVQHSFHHIQQMPSASTTGRSSAGRPAHALVSFGFGGKLIVMKSQSSFQSPSFSSKDSVEGSISVLNLLEVVTGKTNGSVSGMKTCDYFHALTQQSYPGPLAGGNVSSKDLNRWIDERIANSESSDVDYRKGEALKLLFSLLKIACQHYGKLRSAFGGDTVLKENDTPESAVARLFASVKKNGSHYGAPSQCMQQLPSDGQILATASEVQNLLVSGRKIEALQCAQGGQLWGPALVLASQLGDQFYLDTVKQMALRQLVAGSPLRTLCLLIAGQPAEVFSTVNTNNNVNAPAQPAQLGTNFMLDDWEENLAVISANRTKDDELVILHLGDCLWRERSEITAAHICYLIAETNFESYSDSARLCLIGADHWKFPRTYASPEAIQRTELYEYSKLLGNSQFILLPFQSYKIVYAHMLAEVGKVSESLKYCQAVLKSLKTGRAPEVETWRQSVLLLEDRVKVHQQSGYAANLAPGKLVSKLRNLIDSTAHLVVGGPPPPPVQSFSPGITLVSDNYQQQAGPKVSGSQSTMAMSSLMPSASMEPMSEWAADGSRMTMHNRSVSEPDFGRTPRQVDGKEAAPSASQGKASTAGGGSRFSRFGFGSQLIQKTVGLVLRPRQDKQAKLGEKNKFYYDEKLKRWVEEGAEPPAEEGALAPPPTTAAFQNGTQDYNLKPASNSWSPPTNGSPKFKHSSPVDHASGIPPIPNSNNQFSARGRIGVRSRYVDTFNQGGGNQVNFLQSSAVKPAAMATNAKFFVPTPVPTTEQTTAVVESEQRENVTGEPPSTSVPYDASLSAPQPSTTMPRYASMDNIERKENMMDGLSVSASNSRRVASWSGSFSNSSTPPKINQIKSPTGATMVSPPPFMPSPVGIGTFGDELHEVEL